MTKATETFEKSVVPAKVKGNVKARPPGSERRSPRSKRNNAKVYYIIFPENREAFFETTEADRDAKMQELSKKGITFTIKESLTFPYVQKYIHQHNLQWQKKEKSYMHQLLSQDGGKVESLHEDNLSVKDKGNGGFIPLWLHFMFVSFATDTSFLPYRQSEWLECQHSYCNQRH